MDAVSRPPALRALLTYALSVQSVCCVHASPLPSLNTNTVTNIPDWNYFLSIKLPSQLSAFCRMRRVNNSGTTTEHVRQNFTTFSYLNCCCHYILSNSAAQLRCLQNRCSFAPIVGLLFLDRILSLDTNRTYAQLLSILVDRIVPHFKVWQVIGIQL
jgi:hypothetical protein